MSVLCCCVKKGRERRKGSCKRFVIHCTLASSPWGGGNRAEACWCAIRRAKILRTIKPFGMMISTYLSRDKLVDQEPCRVLRLKKKREVKKVQSRKKTPFLPLVHACFKDNQYCCIGHARNLMCVDVTTVQNGWCGWDTVLVGILTVHTPTRSAGWFHTKKGG